MPLADGLLAAQAQLQRDDAKARPSGDLAPQDPQEAPPPRLQLAKRLENFESSAIRALLSSKKKARFNLGGGFPDKDSLDVKGVSLAFGEVAEKDMGGAMEYGSTEGNLGLREKLVDVLKKEDGVEGISAEDMIITTGSQQALHLLALTLIDPGDIVIVEEPTFLNAVNTFKLAQAVVIPAPNDARGQLDVDALRELIRTLPSKPKFIYVVPNYSNPCGHVMSIEQRRKLVGLTLDGIGVIDDNPYGKLGFGDEPPPPTVLALSQEVPASRDLIFYLGSLSKEVCPGARIGYAVIPNAVVRKGVHQCKQVADACSSKMAQCVIERYLESGRRSKALKRTRAIYAENAKWMCEALQSELGGAVKFNWPQGGFFVWVKLTGAGGALSDGSELAAKALDKGVSIVPGAPFFAGKPDKSTFRLSFAPVPAALAPEQRKKYITDAIKELAAVILEPCGEAKPDPEPDMRMFDAKRAAS
jgi:DNA-binding transcriptional MocR family regulator